MTEMNTQQTTQELPTIFTVRELAAYLRIGLNTAYALVKDGKIPSTKVGRQIRIHRDDVYAFMHRTM